MKRISIGLTVALFTVTLILSISQATPAEIIVTRDIVRQVIVKEKPEPPKPLGEFTITYYDCGVSSCGKSKSNPAYGITKSGARVMEGVTVAVDPKVIPLGTYLYIEGVGYRVAQDTGSAVKGNTIDVYVDEYNNEGKQKDIKVWVLNKDVYLDD